MIHFDQVHGMALVVGAPRKSCRQYGVPVGGPMNALSFSRLNEALGNSNRMAGLEMTGRFRFSVHKPVQIMVGPAGARLTIDGKAAWAGRLLSLQRGQVVEVVPPTQGLWTQLAVRGGFDLPRLLGSSGTCLAGGFGGLNGRLIEQGDILEVADPTGNHEPVSNVAMPALEVRNNTITVLAAKGPEFDALFGDSTACGAQQEAWELSLHSNRMGYRFNGQGQYCHQLPNLPSYTCTPGLVQIPPDGNAIVLMADAQVTGGYPRAGFVLASEIWKVSLLSPGQHLRFEWVSSSNCSQYNEKAAMQWRRFATALAEQRSRQTK